MRKHPCNIVVCVKVGLNQFVNSLLIPRWYLVPGRNRNFICNEKVVKMSCYKFSCSFSIAYDFYNVFPVEITLMAQKLLGLIIVIVR